MENRSGRGIPKSFRIQAAETQGARIDILNKKLDKEKRRPVFVRIFRRGVIKRINNELDQERTIADSFNFGS
jgi:hypothetical protein